MNEKDIAFHEFSLAINDLCQDKHFKGMKGKRQLTFFESSFPKAVKERIKKIAKFSKILVKEHLTYSRKLNEWRKEFRKIVVATIKRYIKDRGQVPTARDLEWYAIPNIDKLLYGNIRIVNPKWEDKRIFGKLVEQALDEIKRESFKGCI